MPDIKKEDDWMTKKWRPMMALMYMICCLFDFALFPILFTVVQFWEVQAANDAFRQWVPITLQGGGLFHVAMGAVLGVSAYGRTQEKINGVATPTLSTAVPTVPPATIVQPPAPVAVYAAPTVQPPQFQPINNAGLTMMGGKVAPIPAAQPEL